MHGRGAVAEGIGDQAHDGILREADELRAVNSASTATRAPKIVGLSPPALVAASDAFQRMVRQFRKFDLAAITGPDDSARVHHRHHAGAADQLAAGVLDRDMSQQSGPEGLDLRAGIAQAGDAQARACRETEPAVARQGQQVQPGQRDVLAQASGRQAEALLIELVEQLHGQQVDLAQVRLGRVDRHPGTMPDGLAAVRVPVDAKSLQATYRWHGLLGETMDRVDRYRLDLSLHGPAPRVDHGRHSSVVFRN